ncbi:rhomboid-related protein 4-like [Lineus longissimus]|uniref:rhomboid-related protein 4-like n=1 Tax=Lineus longissimus TaxID=88925 RepID=UPI002B4EDA49
MFRGRNRGTQGGGLAIMLLAYQLMQVGFDRIPPVTLAAILGQVLVFLKLIDIPWPSLDDVCISSNQVWNRGDWTRLILGVFHHADQWHLYYNMSSFLWKGINLERKLGSGYFAFLLAVFTVLQSTILVAVNMLLGNYIMNDASYLSQCAVGFSGVLFALKVLTTYDLPPGIQYIMGIPIHSRLAVWAELAFIQVIAPNASFTGHLSGILLGLLYVKGPLKFVMKEFYSIISSTASGRPHQAYTFHSSGTSGRRAENLQQESMPTQSGGMPATPTRRSERLRHQSPGRDQTPGHLGRNYAAYTGGLTEDEQLARAMNESLQQSQSNNAAPPQTATAPTAPPEPPSYDSLYGESNGIPQARIPPPPPGYEGAGSSLNDIPTVTQPLSNDDIRKRRLRRFQKD